MSNEEKALKLADLSKTPDEEDRYFISNRCQVYDKCLEMAQWKDSQFDMAFDKALEHHANKLKEGKITQYGMDNVFAFVENVRYILAHEC